MSNQYSILAIGIVLLSGCGRPNVGHEQGSSNGDPKKLITAEYKLLNGKQLAQLMGYPDAPLIESNLFAVGYLKNHSPRTSQVQCRIKCRYVIKTKDWSAPDSVSEEIPGFILLGPDGKVAHPFIVELGISTSPELIDQSTIQSEFIVEKLWSK